MTPIEISYYLNKKDNKGAPTSVTAVFNMIRDGITAKEQKAIRNQPDKEKRQELKGKLPAVTWSGLFEMRKKEQLLRHSGIICLDIDGLDGLAELDWLLQQVCADTRTYACFISPSGNGLKVMYRIALLSEPVVSVAQHESYWGGCAEYFLQKFNISADESGKDSSRLCFIAADPKLYVNDSAEPVKLEEIKLLFDRRVKRLADDLKKKSKAVPAGKQIEILEEPICEQLDKVRAFTDNKMKYGEGTRNNYLYLFACNANRRRISQDDTLGYCNANFDLDEKETQASVASAYKHHMHEHGKYAKGLSGGGNHAQIAGIEDHEDSEFDESSQFWYESENEKTGKKEIRFSYRLCKEFLTRNGFYKYPLEEDYQLIRITGRIVTIVRERHIREFIFRYLKKNDEALSDVHEMMSRGAKTYLSTHLFEQLEYHEPEMMRDTKEACYIYFKSSFYQINTDGVYKKSYETDMTGAVWSRQIIDFDYEETDYTDGDFYKFLCLSMNGFLLGADGPLWMDSKDSREVDSEEYQRSLQRIAGVCSGIGYTLHGWKDPSNSKAFIAVDRFKSKAGEPNGRTGKSLLAKAFSKMINVCTLDGPNFRFDKDFAFQKANVDTKLINFNDVTKNFDFNKLFGMITEEFSFEKKRIDQITIPFKDSPKFYVSTNFTLRGEGESNLGRQYTVEFSNYFTTERTPVTVFGRRFFDEWTQEEYCRFYSCMLHCIRMYLKNGLVEFPLDSYLERKLTDMAGDEFIVWMDETVLFNEGSHKSPEFEKSDMLKQYRERSGMDKTTPNIFTKFLTAYAHLRGYEINKHTISGRDRKGGKDYITFYKA
jgi:hypothetical protein